MAKVVKGQFEGAGLYADEFLRHANLLADLEREEVIFLATLHRHFTEANPSDKVFDCDWLSAGWAD